jgi:hypothetical protein
MSDDNTDETLDILWGIDAIARYINATPRKAYWLAQNGRIPVQKKGGVYCASKSVLRADLQA